jgi:hypothetical protein
MYRWTLRARLYYWFSLLPWLSLRWTHAVASENTRFTKLPVWVFGIDALASLLLHGLFLTALRLLIGWLPIAATLGWSLTLLVGGMFIFGWLRRPLAAIVGTALVAIAATTDDLRAVTLGTANLITWLLLACEKREFHNVWMFKPIRLERLDTGSARTLEGHVQVLHLFLDTPRTKWTQRLRLTALRQSKCACRWLVRGAAAYRVPLEFAHHIANRDAVLYSGEIPTASNGYAELDKFEEFLSGVLANNHAPLGEASKQPSEQYHCLIVHLADHIGPQAYAVPRHRSETESTVAVEYTVVGAWRSASVYAHELLHLFGADDLQLSSHCNTESSRKWDDLRRSMLGRSIMFEVDGPLGQFLIDEQTAQCIGWI